MNLCQTIGFALTLVLACGSQTGCHTTLHGAASVHALPVSARSVHPTATGGSFAAQAPNAALAITHVRTLPLYKEAQQACASNHYSHAADVLLKLSRSPNLTIDEVAFCLTQANVCRRDLRPVSVSAMPDAAKLTPGADLTPPKANTASNADCGPRALAIVCQQLKVRTDIAALRNSAGTTKNGTTMEGLAKAVQSVGLKADGIQTGRDALPHTQMPAIAWCGNHYIAVLEIKGGPGDAGTAVVHDPNQNHETVITQEQLLRKSNGGYLLLVHR